MNILCPDEFLYAAAEEAQYAKVVLNENDNNRFSVSVLSDLHEAKIAIERSAIFLCTWLARGEENNE